MKLSCERSAFLLNSFSEAGRGAAWQRTCLGSRGSAVQIRSPRPERALFLTSLHYFSFPINLKAARSPALRIRSIGRMETALSSSSSVESHLGHVCPLFTFKVLLKRYLRQKFLSDILSKGEPNEMEIVFYIRIFFICVGVCSCSFKNAS
jgi:hypothetical protein